jgi:hypothetical protein
VNVGAGAANGNHDYAINFTSGAAGSTFGSWLGAITKSADNLVFGARGAASGTGKAAAAMLESSIASFGGWFGGSSDGSGKPAGS